MYAFWKYDLFPHLLGGKIEEAATSPGCFKVKGYGGYVIKAAFTLDDEPGKKLHERLCALRNEYHQRRAALTREFDRQVEDALKEVGQGPG